MKRLVFSFTRLRRVLWACGAAGSALPWHGRGRRFDPDQVHQILFTLEHPALSRSPMTKPKNNLKPAQGLRGWKQISEFMGLPESTVQRWASEGMPVARSGRIVTAIPEELNQWLDRNTGQRDDVHIATESTDLAGDLKK